jgi:hypothetical protein
MRFLRVRVRSGRSRLPRLLDEQVVGDPHDQIADQLMTEHHPGQQLLAVIAGLVRRRGYGASFDGNIDLLISIVSWSSV